MGWDVAKVARHCLTIDVPHTALCPGARLSVGASLKRGNLFRADARHPEKGLPDRSTHLQIGMLVIGLRTSTHRDYERPTDRRRALGATPKSSWCHSAA